MLYAARLGSVRGDLANGFELDIITIVLLGGVSIFGGSGTMLGVGLADPDRAQPAQRLGLANVDGNTQTGVDRRDPHRARCSPSNAIERLAGPLRTG